jgi:hypothetical protein
MRHGGGRLNLGSRKMEGEVAGGGRRRQSEEKRSRGRGGKREEEDSLGNLTFAFKVTLVTHQDHYRVILILHSLYLNIIKEKYNIKLR